MRIAEIALDRGKTLIFDTDDHDENVFAPFYPRFYMVGAFEGCQWFRENSHGITVASKPLLEHYNGVVIENGFDTTLPQFQPHPRSFYEDTEGAWTKIVYGASSTHARDLEMFYRLGFFEEFMSEHRIDFHLYGLDKEPLTRKCGKGQIVSHPMHPRGIEWYIHDYYCDADFLIAPLIQDDFNDNRSTLKLVEAGIAGKTILASRVKSYEQYEGRDGVSLVDNTPEQWTNALTDLLNTDWRNKRAQINTDIVRTQYNAEVLTAKRIKYYEEILNG